MAGAGGAGRGHGSGEARPRSPARPRSVRAALRPLIARAARRARPRARSPVARWRPRARKAAGARPPSLSCGRIRRPGGDAGSSLSPIGAGEHFANDDNSNNDNNDNNNWSGALASRRMSMTGAMHAMRRPSLSLYREPAGQGVTMAPRSPWSGAVAMLAGDEMGRAHRRPERCVSCALFYTWPGPAWAGSL
jgi:hypothetical protein